MAASATVYEQQAWIIDPANPTVTVTSGTGASVGGGGQRLSSKTSVGSVRHYASGRSRTVTSASSTEQYTLALIRCVESEADQLDAWRVAGIVLLFRDTYGQRVFGSIFDCNRMYEIHSKFDNAQPNSDTNGPFVNVGITINAVSVPDGT